MTQDPVFNPKKRKVLRKYIPLTENISAFLLLCGLVGIVLWVAVQRNNYNPGERDVSIEQLSQNSNPEKLYNLPLKPWVEPGTSPESATQDLGVFPKAILDEDWQVSSRLKQFGPENLFEKIDGEAEKFLRHGFKSLSYLVLKSKGDGSELSIELYDQGDVKGSIGIFSDHVSNDKTLEQQGPVTFFKTSAGAIGRKGKYFFRIAGSQENEKIRKKSEQVAIAFSQLGESEPDTLEESRILRGLGVSPELITYQSKNVFQFDFAKDFWFGQLHPENPARAFVHRVTAEEDVEKLFVEIVKEQSYDYEIVAETDARVVMFHHFLKNYFVMGRQGPFIFGIENLDDKNQIEPMMERFLKELQSG